MYIVPSYDVLILQLTAQKMNFSIKDFFSKCDQIRRKLQIWSHLLKKSLTENLTFCAVVPASLDPWIFETYVTFFYIIAKRFIKHFNLVCKVEDD